MRSIAIYYGIVDQPDSVRKIHRRPVAYLGGRRRFHGVDGGIGAESTASRRAAIGDAFASQVVHRRRGRGNRLPRLVG